MLVPGTALYVPIELKLAEVRAILPRRLKRETPAGWEHTITRGGNIVRPSRLRPSQIAWHDGFVRAGGYSRLVVATLLARGWCAWVIDRPGREQLMGWKDGYPLEQLHLVAEDNRLDLDAWWQGPRAWWQEQLASAALGQPHQPAAEPAGAIKRAAR
jgi:hypothetical protein